MGWQYYDSGMTPPRGGIYFSLRATLACVLAALTIDLGLRIL
jgi:hypothetical protein